MSSYGQMSASFPEFAILIFNNDFPQGLHRLSTGFLEFSTGEPEVFHRVLRQHQDSGNFLGNSSKGDRHFRIALF